MSAHIYINLLGEKTERIMSSLRLLKSNAYNAFLNMAVDEAILQARIEERVPNTLRLYRWQPSAVSIGRFQNIHDEVNLDECRASGIDVVRRTSGGGAVYHDSEGEITYSVILGRGDLGTDDVVETYNFICSGLIEAVSLLGLNAEYDRGSSRQCPNITVGGRKISGSAQANRRGVLLQHGTLLVDIDLKRMFTFLRVPWSRSNPDFTRIVESKISSLSNELGKRDSTDRVCHAIIKGFKTALGINLTEELLTDYEWNLARRLEKEKFATHRWNFQAHLPEAEAGRLGPKPMS